MSEIDISVSKIWKFLIWRSSGEDVSGESLELR